MFNKKIIYLIGFFVIFINCEVTYAVDVTDESNTNLETLTIENTLLYPAFDNNVTEYDAEVSNSTTSLNILAIPENENAKAEIVWDNDLKEGNNLITINVTAEDGVTQKVYEINVYKRNEEEEIVYEQEQEENQRKLQEIYNTQNLIASTYTSEKTSQNVSVDTKSNRFIVVIVISTVISVLIFAIIYKYIK